MPTRPQDRMRILELIRQPAPPYQLPPSTPICLLHVPVYKRMIITRFWRKRKGTDGTRPCLFSSMNSCIQSIQVYSSLLPHYTQPSHNVGSPSRQCRRVEEAARWCVTRRRLVARANPSIQLSRSWLPIATSRPTRRASYVTHSSPATRTDPSYRDSKPWTTLT